MLCRHNLIFNFIQSVESKENVEEKSDEDEELQILDRNIESTEDVSNYKIIFGFQDKYSFNLSSFNIIGVNTNHF